MEVVQHRADRQDAVRVVQHGLDDVHAGHGDGVVGRTLALDDAVGRVLDLLMNLLALVGVKRLMAGQRLPVAHRHAADGGRRPQRDLGITVLAGDVGMHVLDVDAGLLRDQEAQTGGVQIGAGTEHLIGRQAGQLERDMGDDIHRVGDEHIDGVGCHIHHARNDGLHDVDGCTGKIETGLPGLLTGACGDDDHVGVTADLHVVGTLQGDGREEAGAVLHIEHLGLDAVLGDVLEDDLSSHTALGGGEGQRGADGSGTDDGELCGLNGGIHHVVTSLSGMQTPGERPGFF